MIIFSLNFLKLILLKSRAQSMRALYLAFFFGPEAQLYSETVLLCASFPGTRAHSGSLSRSLLLVRSPIAVSRVSSLETPSLRADLCCQVTDMKLTVKTLKGSHFEIKVQPSDTVSLAFPLSFFFLFFFFFFFQFWISHYEWFSCNLLGCFESYWETERERWLNVP